jgi:hypothetical protein
MPCQSTPLCSGVPAAGSTDIETHCSVVPAGLHYYVDYAQNLAMGNRRARTFHAYQSARNGPEQSFERVLSAHKKSDDRCPLFNDFRSCSISDVVGQKEAEFAGLVWVWNKSLTLSN